MSELKSFEQMGRGYQEKVLQAMFEDAQYAEMMTDVLEPSYFTFTHLQRLAEVFLEYRNRYRTFPSIEVAYLQLQQEDDGRDPGMMAMAAGFVVKMKETPLNGDRPFVHESSLEFCKTQKLIQAIGKLLEQVEGKRFDQLDRTLREALDKGSARDHGHDYAEEIEVRAEKSVREPIPTGWPVLDKHLGGGWERKTITTFIAPTGAGKSMALVNASAALVAQGYNVLYVTLEMADYKIGLRHDSWFSGLSIDDSSKVENRDKIREAISERAKGKLIIKEWPTKRATVETIRSHVQRLAQTKNFVPDAILVDYPDLMKAARSYGEKRHELEGNYEELRGLAQELNCVMIVADQTNRSGLDEELVTISNIAEAYAKATVCDLIITVTRTTEDKMDGTGKFYIAKSRLGSDGIVLPFTLKTSHNVRIDVMDSGTDAITMMMKTKGPEAMNNFLKNRIDDIEAKKKANGGNGK